MVTAGGDRQEVHESIRVHSQAAAARVKQEGQDNDLLDRIRADELFSPIHEDLDSLLDLSTFIGRAPQQVHAFIENEVSPALQSYSQALGRAAELKV